MTMEVLNISRYMEEYRSLNPPENDFPVENTVENLTEYFNCPICRGSINDPTQTQCGHVFCQECLNSLIKNPPSVCPLCKTRITHRGLNPRLDIADLATMVESLCAEFQNELTSFWGGGKGDSPLKQWNGELSNTKKSSKAFDLLTTIATTDIEDENETIEVIDIAGSSSSPGRSPCPQLQKTKEPRNANPSANQRVISCPNTNPSPSSFSDPKALQYIIFTTSAVPQAVNDASALDLTKKKSEEGYTYVYGSAFKFIKPLDLSLKKRKRDAECVEPEPSTSRIAFQNLNKRGKFEVKCVVSDNNKKTKEMTSSANMAEVPGKDVGAIKMTNSDELLCKIADEVATSNPISKQPDPGPVTAPMRVATKPRGKNTQSLPPQPTSSDNVFKLPISLSTLKALPKSQNTRKDNGSVGNMASKTINLDCVDDFLLPRDSDALFLNVPESDFCSTPTSTKDSTEKNKKSTQKNVEGTGAEIITSPVSLTRKKTDVSTLGAGFCVEDQDLFGLESDDWMNGVSTGAVRSQTKKDETTNPHLGKPIISENNELNSDFALGGSEKIVFCASRLKKSQLGVLRRVSDMVGGSITKEVSPNFSHLVIILDDGRVAQTFKYLLAIAGHKWVVTFDWIQKCLEEGALIPELEYEASRENFEHCDSGVRRSRLSKTNLLEGFKFFFATEPYKNLGFTFDEVGMLLHQLGAEVLMDENEADAENKLIIIGCKSTGSLTSYNFWLNSRKFVTVTFDWILDSILEYTLQPLSKKYLCVGGDLSWRELRTLNIPESLKTLV